MKVQICNNSGQLESFAPHHRGRDIRIPSKYITREPKEKKLQCKYILLHTATSTLSSVRLLAIDS